MAKDKIEIRTIDTQEESNANNAAKSTAPTKRRGRPKKAEANLVEVSEDELKEEQAKIVEAQKALSEFRELVGTTGYHTLTKERILAVTKYGTTKDKISLMLHANYEMEETDLTPLLSKKQVEEIRVEIATHGEREKIAYMDYLAIYKTLRYIKVYFQKYKYSYESIAYQTAIYFNTYEWLTKAEEFFNSVAPLVDPNKKAEFKKVADNYNSYLQKYQTFGEILSIEEQEWFEDKEKADCLTYAKALSTNNHILSCTYALSQLKGAVEAIDQWIYDKDAQILVPLYLGEMLIFTKHEFVAELDSKYFANHLKTIEATGKTPTEAERDIAVFPIYDEVERNEDTYNHIYKTLDDYYKSKTFSR